MNIGFSSMTHLGLVSAIGLAHKGYKLVCHDNDQDLIVKLKAGHLPVSEPQLDDLLHSSRDAITFTSEPSDLSACDLVYYARDIPTNDSGDSDLTNVYAEIPQITAALKGEGVFVVLSQVPPGFTSNLDFPKDRLFYQVETLIFGRAVERTLNPERYIVGCADPLRPLPTVFRELLEADECPILPMRYESAELAKISINMCLVASVSVANTLAEICEHIGADWSEIVPALKLDKRIGPYSYLKPGLGIAGGNLERDMATVISIGSKFQTHTEVIQSWIHNSQYRKLWAARLLQKLRDPDPDTTVGILGLAYKENTHSIKNSPSIETILNLSDYQIVVHDPLVRLSGPNFAHVTQVDHLGEVMEAADILMILTPWPDYREITPEALSQTFKGSDIIDPYAILSFECRQNQEFRYHTLGDGSQTI